MKPASKRASVTLDARPLGKSETTSLVIQEPLLSKIKLLQKITGARKADIMRELMEIATSAEIEHRTMVDLITSRSKLEEAVLAAARIQAEEWDEGLEDLPAGAYIERVSIRHNHYALREDHLRLEGIIVVTARLSEDATPSFNAPYIFEGGIYEDRRLEFEIGPIQRAE
jgi:hypothetical protein